MLIGIDLIMNGNSKLIGCCATSNQHMSQCFTKLFKQKTPSVSEEEQKQEPERSRKEI